jgi:hypothetical protein
VIPLFVVEISCVSPSSRRRPLVTHRANINSHATSSFRRHRASASTSGVVYASRASSNLSSPARARPTHPRARSRAIARRDASSFFRAHLNDDRPPVPTAPLVTLGGGTLKSFPGLTLIARARAKSAGSARAAAHASVSRHRAAADAVNRRASARDISRWRRSRSADGAIEWGCAQPRGRRAPRRHPTRRTRRRDERAMQKKRKNDYNARARVARRGDDAREVTDI